jgi:hypothetical protein
VCQAAGGCRLTGDSCTSDSTCCGGGSNPNGSVTCDQNRCDNGQSCNPVGNICGATVLPDGGKINAPQSCCDGQKDVCKLDSSGIPRCFGGRTGECPSGYTGTAPCCIAEGQTCQFRDQCCNGLPCLPKTDGGEGYACQGNSCLPLGADCGSGGTCCAGTVCQGGEFGSSCQTPTTPVGTCKANGTSCTTSGSCCSGQCIDGSCAVPRECQPQAGACTTSADCCTGLQCNLNGGVGTCGAASCSSSGQTCSTAVPCCSGLQCLNGTYNPCTEGQSCQCVVVLN